MQRSDLLKKRRLDAARRSEMMENKGAAITPELMAEMAKIFGGDINSASAAASELAAEHELFANTNTLQQLEEHSVQTVVGIGYYIKGKVIGYILVSNANKSGHGFPGGRVTPGESPEVTLMREVEEETGLECRVIRLVTEFLVGEEGHKFSAYEIEFTGGKIKVPALNREEPIDGVIAVEGDLLERACQENGMIEVKGLATKGILPSHRRSYLTFLATPAQPQVTGVEDVQPQPTF